MTKDYGEVTRERRYYYGVKYYDSKPKSWFKD